MNRVQIDRWRVHNADRAEYLNQDRIQVRLRVLDAIPPGGWRVLVSPHGTKAA
jgi:hypothetical protein